jgi:hypothetical protein
MSLPLIKARIKADIGAIAGIDPSLVHLGQRLWLPEIVASAGQDPAFATPQIHIWMVCPSTTDEQPHSTSSRLRSHRVMIRAWYQALDPTMVPDAAAVGTSMASELIFLNLREAVCTKLRNDAHMNGGDVALHLSPPIVTTWDLREVEGAEDVVCHYCEIEVTAEEEMIFAWES